MPVREILKRPHALAIVSFLAIPAIFVPAMMLIILIDPEIALRTSNYERNFQLVILLKQLCMAALSLVALGLWFLACFFLIRSKKRSYLWLPLAALGPFGLIVLSMLRDNAPDPEDRYQRFVGKLNPYVRAGYELIFFGRVGCGVSSHDPEARPHDHVRSRNHRSFHGANHRSTKRLQRHVRVQRGFGSVVSGEFLLFVVAALFQPRRTFSQTAYVG
jgi:hypothetical protein